MIENSFPASPDPGAGKVGANPRDLVQDTAGNRGYGILAARDLLLDAEYELARA